MNCGSEARGRRLSLAHRKWQSLDPASSNFTSLSTLSHHGRYPQSRADLAFVSLGGRRKDSSCLSNALGLVSWYLETCTGGHPTRDSPLSKGGERPCLLGKCLFRGEHGRLAVLCAPIPGAWWLRTGLPAPALEADVLSPVPWWLRAERGCARRTRSPGRGSGMGKSNSLDGPT